MKLLVIYVKCKPHLIKVASDDVHISCQCLQVVVALLGTEVARTEDVLNLARHQQLLKLCW